MADQNLYQESGVDVQKGDELVEWLKQSDQHATHQSSIGGFAGLFRPNFKNMEEPLLVAGTDGVGTKVLLGLQENTLEGLGIDLVAMCVNDLYCIGASPLFFLDYYATGVLDESQFKAVLTGIRKGLAMCKCVLLGGETAELPGLYAKGHFDLAGFVVGAVDAKKQLGPERVQTGDALIAIESSGFHSNGYSLVRKWLENKPQNPETMKKIMEPTTIYGCLPKIFEEHGSTIHALANITGGGISGNLPRVMPKGAVCTLKQENIPTPDWMKAFIEENGAQFSDVEPVFNMGAGMILAVEDGQQDNIIEAFAKHRIKGVTIGHVTITGDEEAKVTYE